MGTRIMALACHPPTWEAVAEGSVFETSLGYRRVTLSLKKKGRGCTSVAKGWPGLDKAQP